VVDDDIQVQKVVCGILTRNNYNVMTASSGEEALEVFQTHRDLIDLVVLDIGMPGMGGYQCLESFRQIDKDIRVLIASGYSDEGPLQNAFEKGASGYIGKPYHMKDFLHKIREMISLNEP
jgi:CheY-like chemotaxis protein